MYILFYVSISHMLAFVNGFSSYEVPALLMYSSSPATVFCLILMYLN